MSSASAAARFGMELRRLRRMHGLSQRGFVRTLGLTAHSNLVQYELGRRIPPGDIVAACEQIFGPEARHLRELWALALAERADGARGLSGAATATGRHGVSADVESLRRDAPAMLPTGVAGFTGRLAQLRQLADMSVVPDGSSAVAIIAITGTAGVGKPVP